MLICADMELLGKKGRRGSMPSKAYAPEIGRTFSRLSGRRGVVEHQARMTRLVFGQIPGDHENNFVIMEANLQSF